MNETHLIIAWSSASALHNKIVDDLGGHQTLRLLDVTDWTWPDPLANMSRFYGTNLTGNAHGKGLGRFRAFVVEDTDPKYAERKTTKGLRLVNTSLFDLKAKYRTGGGFKVHATDNLSESRRDIALLYGFPSRFFQDPWDQKVRECEAPLVGQNGWADINQFFMILNECVEYVVMRNFEPLPDQFTVKGHGDIDLLVRGLKHTRNIANSTPVFPQEHRVHDRVVIGGTKVPFDFRHVGDNYYHRRWQEAMLSTRRLERGFYRPCDIHYFYSLLYHALVHKKEFKPDYRERCSKMATALGIDFDVDNPFPTLKGWMQQNGYMVTKAEPSVGYNRESVRLLS